MPLTKITRGALTADIIDSSKIDEDIELTGNYLKLPSGNTAGRPSGAVGIIRYNSQLNRYEQYDETAEDWIKWAQQSPTISSLTYPGDDTALDTAGSQTLIITGTNYESGLTVTIDGTAPSSVTINSGTQLTCAGTPAKSAGTKTGGVVVTSSAGLTASIDVEYSAVPAWQTAADLGDEWDDTTISTITVAATDATSYALKSGSSLPSGLSLASGGAITGSLSGNNTADYNFYIVATDAQNQTSERQFTLGVFNAPSVEYFMVGGGGAGASGGGGGGGYRTGSITLTPGNTYTIDVAGVKATQGSLRSTQGRNGDSSSFQGVSDAGGGGGAGAYGDPGVTLETRSGRDGATGGGGGGLYHNQTSCPGGTGDPHGDGGTSGSSINTYGGGGGGAGGNASGSTGGSGVSSTITGSTVYYGGGGGGVVFNGTGAGGTGGGGDGTLSAAGDGTANTGGGGGGCHSGAPGDGGSGIVILAYEDTYPAITSVSGVTYSVSVDSSRSGYRVYSFTAGSGSITL